MPGLRELRELRGRESKTETLVEEEVRRLRADWGIEADVFDPTALLEDVRVAMRRLLMRASELGGGQGRL